MAKGKSASQLALTVTRRTAEGRRPARRMRQQGLVPGVVYGRDQQPLPVTINQRQLLRVLHSARGEHALVTLRMDEGKAWEKPALVKEIQHDPVDGHVIHVDFHAIVLTERLRVKVPVALKGEPVGVKQDGGILEHFLREVEVECLPTEIPAHIEFDISALKIGDTVHVRDLAAPSNTKIVSEPTGVIASVQMPKEEKPEEEAAGPAEPEVLREKKEEPEAASAAPARPGEREGRAEEAKAEKPEAKKDTK